MDNNLLLRGTFILKKANKDYFLSSFSIRVYRSSQKQGFTNWTNIMEVKIIYFKVKAKALGYIHQGEQTPFVQGFIEC